MKNKSSEGTIYLQELICEAKEGHNKNTNWNNLRLGKDHF